jgi:hypothetical protein
LCIAIAGAPFEHRAGLVLRFERRVCPHTHSSRHLPLFNHRRTRFTTRQQPVVAFLSCLHRAFVHRQWRMSVPRWSWLTYRSLAHLLLQRAPLGGIVRHI